MRILYNNLFDDYDLIESHEDANYLVENVQDMRLAKVWRTETASAATIYIDAGTGETITCDTAAIINHNFTASAGIIVQASTAATFTPVHLSANVTFRSGPMVVFFNSGAHRFWRFSFDETTLEAGYYEVGRLMLGEFLQVDPSSLVEFPEKHPRSDRLSFSISNQPYSDKGVGHKELKYQFEYATNTMKSSMVTMWDDVGKHTPILFMNYNDKFTVIPPLYCSIIDDMVFDHLKFDKWNFSLSLRECD